MNCDFCKYHNMTEAQTINHIMVDHHDSDVTTLQIIVKLVEVKRELELCRNGVISKK